MTLMALSLVVGILVDDSIVVLENINRHLEMGKEKRKAALDGRNEIGFTALAITLVDVVVFVPMAFSGGLIGNILREFALVVVFSTLMSLLVSFTLTPLLVSRFGKVDVLKSDTLWGRISLVFENFITRFTGGYGRMLSWALGHKRYVFMVVAALLVGSIYLVPAGFIGAAFIPKSDQGEMAVNIELAPTASIYQTNAISQQAEQIILGHPDVITVFTSVGTSGNALATAATSNVATLTVKLTDKKDRILSADQIGQAFKQEISRIPGTRVTIMPVSIGGGGGLPLPSR